MSDLTAKLTKHHTAWLAALSQAIAVVRDTGISIPFPQREIRLLNGPPDAEALGR